MPAAAINAWRFQPYRLSRTTTVQPSNSGQYCTLADIDRDRHAAHAAPADDLSPPDAARKPGDPSHAGGYPNHVLSLTALCPFVTLSKL